MSDIEAMDSGLAGRPGWFAGRRGEALFLAAYLALALTLLNPTLHGRDGLGNYAPLRSWLFDRDLDFSNDYPLFDRETGGAFEFGTIPTEEATGRPGNRYGVGSALLWAPFALPVRTWGAMHGLDETGLESRYAWAIGIGSAFWAGLGLWLLFRLCRAEWGDVGAWAGAGAALLLSPLPFYAFFHTSMSHACAFFAVTSFLSTWRSARIGASPLPYALFGLAGGLAVSVRAQDAAVVAAIFAFEFLLIAHRAVRGCHKTRIRVAGFAFSAFCAFAAFFPQMAAWRVYYGSFYSGPAPYLRDYSEFHLLKPVHAAQVLFSSNHGLFFWHPLLAVGLLGLLTALRRKGAEGRPRSGAFVPGLALAFLATWHLTACWQVWFAGASFGNRLYLSILAAFGVGWAALAAEAEKRRGARIVLISLITAGALWNAGLMAQYGSGLIPRQGSVGFGTLARNQFTEVPRAIGLRLSQALRKELKSPTSRAE